MERVREIVAKFLQQKPVDIQADTVIDNSAIHGSILLRRMYSLLAKEGFHVDNRINITTYGELISVLGHDSGAVRRDRGENPVVLSGLIEVPQAGAGLSVGIDIEEIDSFPIVADYREDQFYVDNFSEKELAYCLLHKDPRVRFAGKFAAKEAILKADNGLQYTKLRDIEILNDLSGKPHFLNFSLSVAHCTTFAIAIAIKSAT